MKYRNTWLLELSTAPICIYDEFYVIQKIKLSIIAIWNVFRNVCYYYHEMEFEKSKNSMLPVV